jgi:hypothetical protein
MRTYHLKPFARAVTEQKPAGEPDARDSAWPERRQPGGYLHPPIGLPRPRHGDSDSAHHRSTDDQGADADHLRPFTGLMVAVGLSVPIWLAIIGLVYYLIWVR